MRPRVNRQKRAKTGDFATFFALEVVKTKFSGVLDHTSGNQTSVIHSLPD
jgi:hypothetical protein